MAGALFVRFPLALQAVYADLRQRASEQAALLVGTPGSISEREQEGRTYLFRQFYDAEGAKAAEHIGPSDDPEARGRAEELRERIAAANQLIGEAQMLARSGYARTDAVLGALANAGLFRAGALLIGSHALGALLNDLGVRVPAIVTEDIDIARPERLAVVVPPFAELLERSRVPLVPVPSLDRKGPSTTFTILPKNRRGSSLRVDLIAPTNGEPRPVPAPELGAHAIGLPFMRYLLAAPVDTVVLGRSSMIPVKAPQPERLAWHKLLVSELRASTSPKKQKDVTQAATLLACLTEDSPETLLAAYAALPASALSKVKRASARAEELLAAHGHVNAVELVRDAVATRKR